ncbi:nucleotidyltransferase family protein [Microvirga solisilvae]|uniref:nucleotidyltransferase family protein n=1 Tax=Microvirga solisilvae TaxID=2919498 RepID=UPI001FB01B74|nr:nucleotidyltransferase domain-containing protein [Microvirga solisilvae]
MIDKLTELQVGVLQEASVFGDSFKTIKTVAIFGSVARGQENADSDIDIAFEWLPIDEIVQDDLLADFQSAQAELDAWKSRLEGRFKRPVSLHLSHPHPLMNDAAEKVILEAIKNSQIRIGKAVLAPTSSVKLT